MDFFESAHLPKKSPSKIDKDSIKVDKKHLKQMLNAYRSGNKEMLKNLAENSPKYDVDDTASISGYSDFNSFREPNETQDSISPDTSLNTSSNNEQSGKTNETISEIGYDDSMGSLSEYTENSRSLPTSYDITTDKDKSSDQDSFLLQSLSNDSYVSLSSSSLGSSNVSELISEDEPFDPDGKLASKIIEKLKSKAKIHLSAQPSTSKENKLQKVCKIDKVSIKKKKKQNPKKSKNISLSEDESFSEIDDEHKHSHILREIQEYSDNSIEQEDIMMDDSVSNDSSPYVLLEAKDMVTQSLDNVIGDYRHSTVKNLPSEKKININSSTNIFEPELMLADDLGEEVESLIPEIDEELAIEDLHLDTTQEPIETTTTEYDDTIITETVTDNEHSNESIQKIKVYPGKDCFILMLKHPAELYIHGKVNVSCLGGTAELFGYTLQEKSIEVFAPYCYYAHSIKTIECQNIYRGLFSKLTSKGISVINAEKIVTNIGEFDVVLCVSKLINLSMDFVDNNCKITELFTKRVDNSVGYLKRAAETLGCSFYDSKQKRRFEEKANWEQVVNCGKTAQSRGIICGGKGTGKSTFLRYYINRILDATGKPVLVLDLDPGQAEFTVPGNISVNVVKGPLVGPNFTHLREPEKTLNLGMINTMDNPTRYVSAVGEIIDYCHRRYRHMPWVVNTMGMCNHMGLKFITYVILQTQPTFVYQIDSKTPKKRFDVDLHTQTIKELYKSYSKDKIFSYVKDPNELEYTFIMERAEDEGQNVGSTMTPREERYLNVLAYFGRLLEFNSSKNLLEIVPYEVNLSSLNVGLNVTIPQEALTKVINGKIIALCQLSPTDKGRLFVLDDKALLCHGHGLIRGIDIENGLLYILTPVQGDKLSLVDTVVYADWMPELLHQGDSLPAGTIIPYRAAAGQHPSRLMHSPRRRFNPLQLLKLTRNT